MYFIMVIRVPALLLLGFWFFLQNFLPGLGSLGSTGGGLAYWHTWGDLQPEYWPWLCTSKSPASLCGPALAVSPGDDPVCSFEA